MKMTRLLPAFLLLSAFCRGLFAQINPVDADLSAHQMQTVYDEARAEYEKAIDSIVHIPGYDRTFNNTVKALEMAGAKFQDKVAIADVLAAMGRDSDIRDAARNVLKAAAGFNVDVIHRDDLYGAVSSYAAKREPLPPEDQALLDEYLRNYRREGMALPAEKRKELTAVEKRLEVLEKDFESNINDDLKFVDVSPEQLKALPKDLYDGAARQPDGSYKLPVTEGGYAQVMAQAPDEGLRRQFMEQMYNRAAEKNAAILQEALARREEKARLLGFDTYADYALEERMAKTPQAVRDFLQRVRTLIDKNLKRDVAEMLDYKRREHPGADALDDADRFYYPRKIKADKLSFDEEEVREYFPLDNVVEGTLRVYQRVLGLKFERQPTRAWHEDVRLYEVSDAAAGKRIGFFYLDLFYRPGKHEHPEMLPIVQGRRLENGEYNEPVSGMLAAYKKTAGGEPILLTMNEVEIFFHEFGHVMHGVLTRRPYPTFSGTSVALDFVEAPSQMLENFVYQPEVLEELSGYYRDPFRKIPKELVDKVIAGRKFQQAFTTARQVAYASLDLAYHSMKTPVDLDGVLQKVFSDAGTTVPPKDTKLESSFGHLMTGYGAGYYSYLWSKVFAQDIFTRFEKEGVLNPAVGMDYRKKILEKGGGHEWDILKDFLGREPNEAAFARSIGAR